MSKVMQIPTRFTERDAWVKRDLEQAAKTTGLSVNQLLIACAKVALPGVVKAVSPDVRLVNVEPLSNRVLDRIYRQPEEDDEVGVKRFMAAQAFGGED